jgi:hypothetical protein
MRRISVQRIRVKPLRVTIDYRIRLVGPAGVGSVLAPRPHLQLRAAPQSFGTSEPVAARECEVVTECEYTETETGMKRPTQTIPRLKARSPRVHGSLTSVPSSAAQIPEPEPKLESDTVPIIIHEQELSEQEIREFPQEPVAVAPVPQPGRRKRSAVSKAKEEPPEAPAPLTRIKVIRRRGEQAAKVFETVTREFPSAMLRGVKMESEEERDSR